MMNFVLILIFIELIGYTQDLSEGPYCEPFIRPQRDDEWLHSTKIRNH